MGAVIDVGRDDPKRVASASHALTEADARAAVDRYDAALRAKLAHDVGG